MPASREQLFAYLDDLGIAHKTKNHVPVFTVEESEGVKADMPGAHTKNLFLKDKAGKLFLICAQNDTQIRINKLHPVLGSKRLSFGKPELLLDTLGVPAGSVTLFSVINDTDNAVTLIIDKTLTEHDIVNFHPLLNDATTAISSTDMVKFAKATGHDPLILNFADLNTGTDAPS